MFASWAAGNGKYCLPLLNNSVAVNLRGWILAFGYYSIEFMYVKMATCQPMWFMQKKKKKMPRVILSFLLQLITRIRIWPFPFLWEIVSPENVCFQSIEIREISFDVQYSSKIKLVGEFRVPSTSRILYGHMISTSECNTFSFGHRKMVAIEDLVW